MTASGRSRGGQRQRVLIARALVQDAPLLLLDEPLSGVDRPSAAQIERVFAELQAEGRALLVATHDVAQARAWPRVLCLNHGQVAFGAPDRGSPTDVLRATYGDELVILDGARPGRHRLPPPRPLAPMLSSGIMQRAFVEAIVLGLACGPLGVWILLLRRSYAAESLSHAMLPGLVIAALAGIPLLFGAAAGVLVAAADPLVARDARRAATSAWRSSSPGCSGSAASSRSRRRRRRGSASCCSATCSGYQRRPGRGGRLLGRRARRARRRLPLAGGAAFARGSAQALGVRPARADLALLAMLAVTTVAAVQGLGNLLLVALILAPAAAALNLASRLPATLALAAGARRARRASRGWSSPTSSRSRPEPASLCALSHFRVLGS